MGFFVRDDLYWDHTNVSEGAVYDAALLPGWQATIES